MMAFQKLTVLLLLLALTAGAALYIALNSRDIPPPDVSDLEVPFPDVPDEENTYVVFREVTSELELSEEERQSRSEDRRYTEDMVWEMGW